MIEFENVTKSYGNGIVILDQLSFAVRQGELLVLIGPSGCGKTTALKLINRLAEPTGGRVLVDGQDVAKQDPVQLRRRIGYVIQQIGLFPHMTVGENVALVPRLKNWDEKKRRDRAHELLDLVGLPAGTYAKRFPRELSGGQQQRVGVARALAADPSIVLMDEPFGAVDPITRRQLQFEMRKIQSALHKTIVFVTHDITEAFLLGDRIGLMRGGHLLQLAAAEEILRQPADDFVREFVGGDNPWRKLDFLRVRDVAQPLNGPLGGNILPDTPTISDSTLLKEALTRMAGQDVEFFAAVDEQGKPTGILTFKTVYALDIASNPGAWHRESALYHPRAGAVRVRDSFSGLGRQVHHPRADSLLATDHRSEYCRRHQEREPRRCRSGSGNGDDAQTNFDRCAIAAGGAAARSLSPSLRCLPISCSSASNTSCNRAVCARRASSVRQICNLSFVLASPVREIANLSYVRGDELRWKHYAFSLKIPNLSSSSCASI